MQNFAKNAKRVFLHEKRHFHQDRHHAKKTRVFFEETRHFHQRRPHLRRGILCVDKSSLGRVEFFV